MLSVVAVLALSANTSFAAFPRLCRVLAVDRFLPESFAHRGRRLAFSHGILVLAALSAALLVAFDGITDRLIPLFAVGAFSAFTLSQAGMVAHFKRAGRRALPKLALNACGAAATSATLVVLLASKFVEGAWISALLIVALVVAFAAAGRRAAAVDAEIRTMAPVDFTARAPPIVIVPMRRWTRVAERALRFAAGLSETVIAVQVLSADRDDEDLSPAWPRVVEEPARAAGVAPPKLLVYQSRYRELYRTLLRAVRHVADANPERQVAVVVPELVERGVLRALLRHHTASILKGLLRLRGKNGVVVISTPSYVDEDVRARA
ncbi:MAG TPA: amino acid permease [Minicystis sp.]|nr:amino acid permease [Minicystis sp.]